MRSKKLFTSGLGIILATAIYLISPIHHHTSHHYLNTDDEKTECANGDISKNLEIPTMMVGIPNQILIREGYTTSYNTGTKCPNWVAWCLTKEHADGQSQRTGEEFTEDEEVMSPRADTYDYSQTGYDRGHMCPAGDNKWSKKAMRQSFLMTNVCPQNKELNRGDWNEIEQQCRYWAKKYGKLYIVCGPIYLHKDHKKIGKDKIWVPDAFFKCILCMEDKPKTIAFICRNTDGSHNKDFYVNSVDNVEKITGMNFFGNLPDNLENRIEKQSNLQDW